MPSTRQAVTAPLNIQQLLQAKQMGLGDYIAQAEMRNHVPSLRERLGNMVYDAARATGLRGNAQSMRTNAQTAMDFVPGLGDVIGAEEAGRDLGAGNYLSGGLGLGMTLIPGAAVENAARRVLYHVAPKNYTGGALQSLYSQFGDDAYKKFAKRWPEADNLGQYHADYVFMYENLEDAMRHPRRGVVLEIDRDALEEYLGEEVPYDMLEIPHGKSRGYPYVQGELPAEFILGPARKNPAR